MAHKILELDSQVGTTMAWHKLTKVIADRPIALKDVFPYEFVRAQLFYDKQAVKNQIAIERGETVLSTDETEKSDYVLSNERTSIISTDNFEEVFSGRDSHSFLTNAQLWDIVTESLAGVDYTIVSAGSLRNRVDRFISVELTKENSFKIGKREFKKFMEIFDNIAGLRRLIVKNSAFNIVCANSAEMVLSDDSGAFALSAKHSKFMNTRLDGQESKIETMKRAIENHIGVAAQFKAAMEACEVVKVSPVDAINIFAGWLNDDAKELSPQSFNTAIDLTDLYRRGKGNSGETLLDVVSAVTDFYTHRSAGGESYTKLLTGKELTVKEQRQLVKQVESSEVGAGNAKKTEFTSRVIKSDADGIFQGIRNQGATGIFQMRATGKALIHDYLSTATNPADARSAYDAVLN